jgi:hypothetical protein
MKESPTIKKHFAQKILANRKCSFRMKEDALTTANSYSMEKHLNEASQDLTAHHITAAL